MPLHERLYASVLPKFTLADEYQTKKAA